MNTRDSLVFDIFATVLSLIGLSIMLWFGYSMIKSKGFESNRTEYLEQAVSKQLVDKNCKHTGYGPGRSYDKVYLCDDGTYRRDSYKLVRLNEK